MIHKTNFCGHDDVLVAHFGTGDIKHSKISVDSEEMQNALMFHNDDTGEIFRTSREWEGKSLSDLPKPEFVLFFTKPESITSLIHSLIEIQSSMMKNGIKQ